MIDKTPGEKIATAISRFIGARDIRYADRPRALDDAFKEMAKAIDEELHKARFNQ